MTNRRNGPFFTLSAAAVLAMAGWIAPAGAQSLIQSEPGRALSGTDLAVLEAREPRDDLPCRLTPIKPVVGFDLKFHAGYEVAIPMRELAGLENLLTVIFRVTPEGAPERAAYFTQKIRVPSIEPDAKGDAYLQGAFDLGEGAYQVDWLMRDRTERVCASFWRAEARLSAKEKDLALTLEPGVVAAAAEDDFADEPPVEKDYSSNPLSVKVLVNFAPQNSNASTLQPADTAALVSILRTIHRDPRIARYSVVAFNLQEQRILYRQEPKDRIDFPSIGQALKGLQLGRVDISRLQNKNSDAEFLGALIQNEFKVRDGEPPPDGLIIAGPKVMLPSGIPADALREVGETEYPVFYLNYNLTPQLTPWRDSISQAVRYFKGLEFTISRPRELWSAVTEVVARIVKWKSGRRATDASIRGSHLAPPQ
ncbi:MAG: acetyltransferase [Bryobacteraceae bacterium]